jgi:pilus assembly protein CpaF
MSLLDRVQRRAEEPGTIDRPTAAPAASDTALVAAPAPAPAPTSSPPLPAPPSAAPSTPPATTRSSSLLTRTGLGRTAGRQGIGLHYALRMKVRQLLVQELAAMQESPPPDAIRQRIAELVNDVAAETATTLPRQDRMRVIETIAHDVLGLGPLEDLLNDQTVTEIMINSASQIYIERAGKIILSDTQFESNEHLMQVIDRIVSGLGRRVDESSPMVDARLKDGSRVNVIIPPLALKGPTVTIRKFAKDALQVDDLVRFGSITPEMAMFVRACVRARLNVIVSGGTGSGKTTTLNMLSGFIPSDERIVTIEDAAELQLHQDHVVTLETRPPNVEGRGRVTIRDLVINALRMRPDRIVVGECRGGEALDMLQAMNTGHDGSLTTLHANNPHDTISRLETMVLMAGAELPSRAIREQIGSAVQLIVHQSRLRDGTRKIVSITEVLGADEHGVRLQELFAFRQTGVDENGAVLGGFVATGAIPTFFEHLQTSGEGVPEELFRARHAA